MTAPQVIITVTDDVIDRAIARLLGAPSRCEDAEYDEDDDEPRPQVDIPAMVRAEVQRRIDKEICKAIQAAVTETVGARVDAILADGFPVFSQWGEKTGTKTLAQLVGEAVFKKDSYSDDLAARARKAMHNSVDSIVREHVQALSGDIKTSMKAAAAEALQKWMANTLGVRA